ncbi:hypothetical protein CLF_110013 [Clonorchis sinensis]|uniref:Uncharacterized protein n=1 Tax=Clonorchis sinensis TaxID=79923 RepID=G7YK47_CLOSI|nr:hypothetical protein CLF_110013 [Clonorchis sinensis]
MSSFAGYKRAIFTHDGFADKRLPKTSRPNHVAFRMHYASRSAQFQLASDDGFFSQRLDEVIIIIIDSMTSVFNTDASLPYNHDSFESLIVKKRIKAAMHGHVKRINVRQQNMALKWSNGSSYIIGKFGRS